jgi:hypothetical protein
MPRVRIINETLQVRYQKSNNKLVILNSMYNIHLRLYPQKRHNKFPVKCKIVDRKTGKTVLVKVFYFDERPNMRELKVAILGHCLPKELKEIESFIIGLSGNFNGMSYSSN